MKILVGILIGLLLSLSAYFYSVEVTSYSKASSILLENGNWEIIEGSLVYYSYNDVCTPLEIQAVAKLSDLKNVKYIIIY